MSDINNGKGIKTSGIDGTDDLIEEAARFLEAGQWKSAEVFCDGVLETDPDNVKVCLCKLLARKHCKSKEALKDLDEPFDDDPLYKKIVELGSMELVAELRKALLFIKARIAEKVEAEKQAIRDEEQEKKAKIYAAAAIKQGEDTVKSLKKAETEFSSLSDWYDSAERAEACRNRIKEIKEAESAAKSAKRSEGKGSRRKLIGILTGPVATIAIIIGLILILRPMFFGETAEYLNVTDDGKVSWNDEYDGVIPRDIVIPKRINGIKVTGIDAAGFSDRTSIKNIEIPSSVESIGFRAFMGCTDLESITIPNSVTNIGGSAFSGCISLDNVVIPESVTTMGSAVFSGCTGLKTVVLANGMTSIPDGTFRGCGGLSDIDIPKSVKSIGEYAFRRCTSLTNVVIPSSVRSIAQSAFSGCEALKSVIIPLSVDSVGIKAFEECINLTVYAEANRKPVDWDLSWNPLLRPVVWGYKGE